MSQTNSEEEKLVEEIVFVIGERAEYDIGTDLYDGLPTGAEMTNAEELAKELITRIGKAYAEGELKIPGEAGRGEIIFHLDREPEIRWYLWHEKGDDDFGKQLPFIALSPTGRGKEEKAD